MKLPTARFANGLRASNGLGQHERANDAEELNEGDGQSACGDQHGALRYDVVERAEAAGAVEVDAIKLAGCRILCER